MIRIDRLLIMALLLSNRLLFAQALFQGMAQPLDARGWGMGAAVASAVKYPSGFSFNPALLANANSQWQLNYTKYVLDVKATSAMLVLSNKGQSGLGLSYGYLDYGKFTARDENASALGEYTVNDKYLRIAYGKKLTSRLNLGIAATWVNSNLADYNAQALLGAIGANYYEPVSTFSWGIAWLNFGWLASGYLNQEEKLPSMLVLAVSKKLEHLPLIIALDLLRLQPAQYTLKLGGEFNLGQHLFLRWGTSTRRFQISSQATLLNFVAGSSLGLGVVVKNWRLDCSWLSLGPAGQVTAFSIGQDIN